MFDAHINIVGTLNLLEAMRASGYATRLIFSSTGGALYGDFVTPPNIEDYPKDPESPYGIAKLSAELYLAYYARLHKIGHRRAAIRQRLRTRQDPHGEAGVVAIFCNRILTGRHSPSFGDGSQTRDYCLREGRGARQSRRRDARSPAPGRLDARGFNIGTEIETSSSRSRRRCSAAPARMSRSRSRRRGPASSSALR
jgi:UDP-glucose 4-epimerase